MFRELTKFEQMVMKFMGRREYTSGYCIRFEAAVAAGKFAEAEEILEDACERYTDWATEDVWATAYEERGGQ